MNAQFPIDNTYSNLPRQLFHKQKPTTDTKSKLKTRNFQIAKKENSFLKNIKKFL